MAIQFGTVDGLVNISSDTILCLAKGIDEFVNQGGPDCARKKGISYGTAFQRFIEPVYSNRSKSFSLSSLSQPVLTRSGSEQSPAKVTFCKKMGLLKIDESSELFEVTPIGKAVLDNSISIEEYAFVLLSKMGVFKDGDYVDNLLNSISKYFQSNATVSQNSLREYIKNAYHDSIIVKTRLDIIINSLVVTGLLTKVSNDIYVLSGTGEAELFIDFNKQSTRLKNAKIDTSVNYSDYIGNLSCGGVFDILTKNNIDIYTKFFPNLFKYIMNVKSNNGFKSLQQIFYGAPGTGKSNTIKREVDEKGKTCFRTTFHPDSDYSTFVGCYKPKMKRSTITKDGVTTTEEKIIYSFEPQAFTNAYVQAWKTHDDVYLIIEEINRGNCAQIFGDLFQLLDRKNGESEYPVDADSSLADYLQTALADSKRDDIPTEVKNGTKLKLPSNLYIWATMNTSDQSLFPIDSAFKRRWEWKYMKIKNEGKEWKIDVKIKNAKEEEMQVDWWDFIHKVNDIIASMTSSADKQLGYFFCKPDKKTLERAELPNSENDLISVDTFVSKVLFYLWNDVFKDYGFEDASLFQYKDNEGKVQDLTFPDFYKEDSNDVNPTMVADFVQKVMNWKKKEEEN